MKIVLFIGLLMLTFASCFEEDPESRMNLNFDNNNYVVDASEDVTISDDAGLYLLADSENFKLEITVDNYNGSGTYANDEIGYKVTFEGIEYINPSTHRNFIVLTDTPTLFAGNYDFRQPDNVTNDTYFAVGSFQITR